MHRWREYRKIFQCIAEDVRETKSLLVSVTYLLGDFATQLCAISFVWGVGVDGNYQVGKLPVDERAQRRQGIKEGKQVNRVHVDDELSISDDDVWLRVRTYTVRRC